jgi:hypothetical protein
MKVIIHHKGETHVADESTWESVLADAIQRLGPWVSGESKVTKEVSTFSQQVVDPTAKARIEQLRAKVGIENTKGQLYDTGTRMAEVGYRRQEARAREHAAKQPLREAADALIERIQAEKRESIVTTAGELGKSLAINGALTFNGLKMQEQAIRGLLARMHSPALGYVLGLRDRIAGAGHGEEDVPAETVRTWKALDRDAILDVMARECRRFADLPIKIRARWGLGDIFAVTSTKYSEADAPEVLPDILRELPHEAKGSFSYDPVTTTWELRASVFTPTPVQEQAVGEPFEGYVSFAGRDNGTRRVTGGGGIIILACLNAGTYQAPTASVSRVHRGQVLLDLTAMAHGATQAIRTLCEAWGLAREEEMEVPALVPMEQVVPGFFRYMLTARRGALLGVLPGRTEERVKHLALTFDSERRDKARIVRSDLAQGFTRYIQGEATPVRRDAEAAIASWIVRREPVRYLAA